VPGDSILDTIGYLIRTYGYLAVFVGTLLEGETVLLAAGFAAHQGLLDWRVVVLVAFAGGTFGDQLAFLLGRWKGNALIERIPALARHAPRVHRLLERFDVFLILLVRFMYGLRVAGPVIMGSSRIALAKFSTLNMAAAMAWAFLIGGAGYLFGAATETLFSHIKHFEVFVLIGVVGAGALLWLWHYLSAKRR
jgi:membrane protein DedA with SNARE-associated domain